MGKSQRTKGHGYEREVAAIIRTLTGYPAKRGFQTRGAEVSDIIGVDGFWIECKRRKARPIPLVALRQAIEEMPEGCEDMPVGITRADGGDSTVTMRLEDWCELIVRCER